jgi:membrane-bound lytic murein transglycosylase D
VEATDWKMGKKELQIKNTVGYHSTPCSEANTDGLGKRRIEQPTVFLGIKNCGLLYIVLFGLWPLISFGQPANDPEFSRLLKQVAPEFEWVSSELVREEAVEILQGQKNHLSEWAVTLSGIPSLAAGLNRSGLPATLQYLPVAFGVSNQLINPESRRNGIWKLHPSVAAKYGLSINSWIDERFDPELSTEAALRQLKEIWFELGPPTLSVLAFLSSPANVRQAQYRSCDALSCRSVFQGMDASTLRLYHRFLAIVYLYAYHREIIPSQALFPSNKIQFHVLDQAEPLSAYAKLLGEDSMAFQKQNPHLLGYVIPKGSRVYSRFSKPAKTLSVEELSSEGYQRCKATGDSLSEIIRRRKLDPFIWLEANGIESLHLQTATPFLIPSSAEQNKPEKAAEDLPLAPSYREPQKPKPEPSIKTRYYVVKSGDTLWSIARKYAGITHNDIQKANRMSNADQIKVGQKLKIPN